MNIFADMVGELGETTGLVYLSHTCVYPERADGEDGMDSMQK